MASLNSVKDALNRRRWKLRLDLYGYSRRWEDAVGAVARIFEVLVPIVAVGALVALALGIGFDRTAFDRRLIAAMLRSAQGIFAAGILFNLIFRTRLTLRSHSALKWASDILVLVTLLPWAYPRPEHPLIPVLDTVLYSRYFIYSVLGAYSVLELSFGVMKLVGKRTNPSLMMAGSFFFFILAGSLALMLPNCTYGPISYIDSLFVSTSAVCITGLTTVDIPATFTPLGQIALCVLFQIGALGVITFTSFFAIFFSGHQSIYSQLMIRDMVYSKTMNSLVPTLFYILMFTLSVEAAGAVAIWFTVPESLYTSPEQHAAIAIFHSLSAFCNVGFSNVEGGMANPAFMHGNQTIYIAMSVLLFAGGIGFPILVNFKNLVPLPVLKSRKRPMSLWQYHP